MAEIDKILKRMAARMREKLITEFGEENVGVIANYGYDVAKEMLAENGGRGITGDPNEIIDEMFRRIVKRVRERLN